MDSGLEKASFYLEDDLKPTGLVFFVSHEQNMRGCTLVLRLNFALKIDPSLFSVLVMWAFGSFALFCIERKSNQLYNEHGISDKLVCIRFSTNRPCGPEGLQPRKGCQFFSSFSLFSIVFLLFGI